MFELDSRSMMAFEDWSGGDLKSIEARTLILTSYQDTVTPEHALQLSRQLPDAELVILRGQHGEFLGNAASAGEESRMPEIAAEIIHDFLSD